MYSRLWKNQILLYVRQSFIPKDEKAARAGEVYRERGDRLPETDMCRARVDGLLADKIQLGRGLKNTLIMTSAQPHRRDAR